MNERMKLGWKIMKGKPIVKGDLQSFLNLLPEKPMAKATNMGKSWMIEFAVKMDRPKAKKKNGPWGNVEQVKK
jgi:hypothetical protein